MNNDFVRMLKLMNAAKKGNPADLMRMLPIEGSGEVAEMMKILPELMSVGAPSGARTNNPAGLDAEIYRLYLSAMGTGVREE